MILKDMYIAIKTVFINLGKEIFIKNDKSAGYVKNTIMSVTVCAVLIGGFYSYRFYINSRESSAYKTLQECVNFFEAAQNGKGVWHDVQMAFDNGYRSNTRSRLAPYFLGFKADALVQQNKTKEAIDTMELALSGMKPNDEFFGMYQAKLALMQLDSADEASKVKAINALQTIAENENSGTGTALYYLGLYYFDKNDIENAKKYWQKLFMYEEKDHAKNVESGLPIKATKYASFAKEKIDQLN